MNFLSVCSGIEAATVAFAPLGWRAVAYSEIEAFPSAVLRHHYPDVPNLGDFTLVEPRKLDRVDLLCGGTPCQTFSIAGLRQSLSDARGNLTLSFVKLAHELADHNGLEWVLWENTTGVLNTEDNAFGCFLAAIVGADDPLQRPFNEGGWPSEGMVEGPRARVAWRVLNAKYFGLPQQRERIFLVANFGEGDPATVLFERQGVFRVTTAGTKAASRARQAASGEVGEGVSGAGWRVGRIDCTPAGISGAVTSKWHKGSGGPAGDEHYNLVVEPGGRVRRFNLLECERLQGFPDDYTNVLFRGKPAADKPRYIAIGNAWPVAVVRWIASRIALQAVPQALNDNLQTFCAKSVQSPLAA